MSGFFEELKETEKRFERLAFEFEPENLYCDGELSEAEARVKLAGLKREWKALEKKAGYSVDPRDILERKYGGGR